jgi:hypothetical protein
MRVPYAGGQRNFTRRPAIFEGLPATLRQGNWSKNLGSAAKAYCAAISVWAGLGATQPEFTEAEIEHRPDRLGCDALLVESGIDDIANCYRLLRILPS